VNPDERFLVSAALAGNLRSEEEIGKAVGWVHTCPHGGFWERRRSRNCVEVTAAAAFSASFVSFAQVGMEAAVA
jgi:hypothetical protein